jgi:hypothetical protein
MFREYLFYELVAISAGSNGIGPKGGIVKIVHIGAGKDFKCFSNYDDRVADQYRDLLNELVNTGDLKKALENLRINIGTVHLTPPVHTPNYTTFVFIPSTGFRDMRSLVFTYIPTFVFAPQRLGG